MSRRAKPIKTQPAPSLDSRKPQRSKPDDSRAQQRRRLLIRKRLRDSHTFIDYLSDTFNTPIGIRVGHAESPILPGKSFVGTGVFRRDHFSRRLNMMIRRCVSVFVLLLG